MGCSLRECSDTSLGIWKTNLLFSKRFAWWSGKSPQHVVIVALDPYSLSIRMVVDVIVSLRLHPVELKPVVGVGKPTRAQNVFCFRGGPFLSPGIGRTSRVYVFLWALRVARQARSRNGFISGALFCNRVASRYHFLFIFRSLEVLWERWGPTFNVQERIGPPEELRGRHWPRHPKKKLTLRDRFGSHVLISFDSLAYVSERVFSFAELRLYFSWFRTIFWFPFLIFLLQLSAPLVLGVGGKLFFPQVQWHQF